MKSFLTLTSPGCVALAALVVVPSITGCSSTGDPDGDGSNAAAVTASGGTGPGAMTWFIAQSSINLLSGADGGAPLVEAYFNSPSAYVLGSVEQWKKTPPPSRSVPAVTFTAVHSFKPSCDDGGVVTGVVEGIAAGLPDDAGAVLYDDEDWCFTPRDEVDSPQALGSAETTAAAAVHDAGVRLLAAPAQDVMLAMPGSGGSGSNDDRYLDAGIPGLAAKHADVYEIQSQALESDPAAFESFVRAAATQARAASKTVRILAGLSTNPSGGPVPTASRLCELVQDTRSVVDGYWLNTPVQGPYCPGCGPDAGADIAIELLRKLENGDCDPTP